MSTRTIRLVILSRSQAIYSTRRLVEAARARGMRVRVIPPTECELHLDEGRSEIFHRRKRMAPADVVIPRIAPSIAPYGLAVLNQLGLSGAQLVNDPDAISASRNKIRSLQLLSSQGISVPATVMGRDARRLRELVPSVGGVPVLVKLLQGGERQGVMVCETIASLEASLEALLGLGENVLIQQYVRGSRGKDIRALVVGDRVICAVRRIPRAGRLSLTLGRGARFEPVEIAPALAEAAIRSARLLGLEVAAVDMLDERGKARVFEVNSSPGLRDLEEATGRDLAGDIVEHAASLVQAARAAARTRRRGAGAR